MSYVGHAGHCFPRTDDANHDCDGGWFSTVNGESQHGCCGSFHWGEQALEFFQRNTCESTGGTEAEEGVDGGAIREGVGAMTIMIMTIMMAVLY